MEKLRWPLPHFEEIFIQESQWETPVAQRVRDLYPTLRQRVRERPYQDGQGALSGRDFDHSKKRLYLGRHEGHFFRKCPGTQGAACCNYFVLNLGVQCNMNCSYCYLQSYINSPLTQIYTNIDEALLELDEICQRNPRSAFRVGTGETIDSLSLDDLSLYSARLVEWFQTKPALTCEFKTKSCNVKNFVNLKHAGNVIVSFSVNPQFIVESEEFNTASLASRLDAAEWASSKGFPVAFHIDPMIYHQDWKENYRVLVHEIVRRFKPSTVKWISLGALRYLPEMKNMLRERFPRSKSLLGELFLSDDGKLRYDQALRTEMFTFVIEEFHKVDRRYPVFLCMETPEAWINTYKATPRKVQGLEDLFEPVNIKTI